MNMVYIQRWDPSVVVGVYVWGGGKKEEQEMTDKETDTGTEEMR